MEKLTIVSGVPASIAAGNVDTDIIFPARFLVVTAKRGLGRYAFHDRPDLKVPAETAILIAGENFGCGSSREQAPWALADCGVRVIVAPSFGEIFASNCYKNGMLPIALPPTDVDRLHDLAKAQHAITVDLISQRIVVAEGEPILFAVDPQQRAALLEGLDEIARIRTRFGTAIARFEAAQRETAPWLWTSEESVSA